MLRFFDPLALIIYFVIIVFGAIMIWRFVKALELIAKSFEKFVDSKRSS